MIAALAAAAIVRIVLVVMVEKARPAALRTLGIWPPTRPPSLPLSRPRAVGGKLVTTGTAEILLITVRVFAITIEVMIVVALRAAEWYTFNHENSSPFGRYSVLW